MTDKAEFHALLINPATGPTLSTWLAEDARADAARADREQRERNDAIVTRYLREWFKGEHASPSRGQAGSE